MVYGGKIEVMKNRFYSNKRANAFFFPKFFPPPLLLSHQGPTFSADAVVGRDGFLVGGEATYDVLSGAITRYAGAVGYSAPEYAVTIHSLGNLSTFAASYYHRVSGGCGCGCGYGSVVYLSADNSFFGFFLFSNFLTSLRFAFLPRSTRTSKPVPRPSTTLNPPPVVSPSKSEPRLTSITPLSLKQRLTTRVSSHSVTLRLFVQVSRLDSVSLWILSD